LAIKEIQNSLPFCYSFNAEQQELDLILIEAATSICRVATGGAGLGILEHPPFNGYPIGLLDNAMMMVCGPLLSH